MSAATENHRVTPSIVPIALALLALMVGVFMPFVGLPVAMIGMVSAVAADIKSPRTRLVTITIVVAAIAVNLALVMVTLPATAQLVDALR